MEHRLDCFKIFIKIYFAVWVFDIFKLEKRINKNQFDI